MRNLLFGLVVLSLSALGYAQPFNPAPAEHSRELVLSGDDGKGSIALTAGAESTVVLQLRNASGSALVATHMGIGSSAILIPIEPIVLEAGGVKPVSLKLDSRRLMVPCELWFYFRCESNGASRVLGTKIKVTVADTVLVLPRVLIWREGGALEEKKARIVSLPKGVRVTGATVSSDTFTARLVGDEIFVKPVTTAGEGKAMVTLVTEPADAKALELNLVVSGKPLKGRK